MSVTISSADLEADRGELLAVLGRNLVDLPHYRRFRWLYHDNPVGPAWSWLARDTTSGEVVGVASLFPRAVWLGSRVALCGQVGDFAVDVSHRTLGPAMMLQRATFQPVHRGEIAFCYDCPPHERGMSTFRRLGMTATTSMLRHAKLLRAERQIRKRCGGGRSSSWVASLGNAVLRARAGEPRRVSGVEVGVHEGRFGDEFSRLDQRVGGGGRIRSRRAAEDLNWRYRDDPLNTYEVFTARRHGEVVGFVVLSVGEEDAAIVDLFCESGADEVCRLLLDVATAQLRDTATQALHARLSEESSLTRVFRAAGFRPRQQGPYIVAYATARVGDQGVLEPRGSWDLVHADIMA
jgi:hypothetical protein